MRCFALLTLSVLAAAGCGGSDPREAQATGTIAFVRGGQLWVMRADGRGQRELARSHGWKGSPAWSPDGTRIAYESRGRNENGSRIFVLNADGSARLRLTGTYEIKYEAHTLPVWSPNGRTIAFEWYDDGDYLIYSVGADGSRARQLTPWDAWDYEGPTWAPDGRSIAFTNIDTEAVYVMRPDGSRRRVLARMKRAERTWGVAWSPDGRRIAFLSDDDLWVMNADGTRRRRLVDNHDRESSDIAWSPDSRTIAFTGGGGISVVNADGSGLRNLTDDDPVLDMDPAWSPDGRAIAFTSDRDGNSEIYVMNSDGTDQHNVSGSPLEDFGPAWSPKG
jgi:Tol biopolymer transport system component